MVSGLPKSGNLIRLERCIALYFIDYDYESLDLDGDSFHKLLTLCFSRSDYCSFTEENSYYKVDTMQKELASYVSRYITTHCWFSYMTLPNNPKTRILYLANNETMKIMERFCHSLFLFKMHTPSYNWKQNLEDLWGLRCFKWVIRVSDKVPAARMSSSSHFPDLRKTEMSRTRSGERKRTNP
jgi:hypothetical protein